MKQLATSALALIVFVAPVAADDDTGLSLMERGALLFMEGIIKEMEPAIEEFSGLAEHMAPAVRNFAEEMGPKLTDMLEQVEDWTAYQPPEMLPNGDIIIRRKPDNPLTPPEGPTESAPQIDL